MREITLWAALAVVAVGLLLALTIARRARRHLGTTSQRAVYDAIRTANLAAPALRAGLDPASAASAVGPLRRLLGTRAVVLADLERVLAFEGADETHAWALQPYLSEVIRSGRSRVVPFAELDLSCPVTCPLQIAVVVPLEVDGTAVGALAGIDGSAEAALLRTAAEVASFVSTQLGLAELAAAKRRAEQAELRFLRAQISPHFIYNALTAIESFVRSDPDRARDLLVDFAEFIRYSFRSYGQFATLADELRLTDTYLDLERARFGDRLQVSLRVAPETLSVVVPSLTLQPLVENAVRHGLEGSGGTGHLDIRIEDAENQALISVEDDGAGIDPAYLRRVLAGQGGSGGVALRNVDERLRTVFGSDHALTIETGIGAGTKVSFRVPKYHAGVRV
ncbi:MAG: histidine kinase [Acidimicrobiales bacterium]